MVIAASLIALLKLVLAPPHPLPEKMGSSLQHRGHEPDHSGLFAGWLPGFGILTHVGRKSGKVYRTPINVFQASSGFIIALTYSSQSEWVKNVLAAGGCELKTRGKKYQLSAPRVIRDPRGSDSRFRCGPFCGSSARTNTWSLSLSRAHD